MERKPIKDLSVERRRMFESMLKLCPFCGHRPHLVSQGKAKGPETSDTICRFLISCGCGASTTTCSSPQGCLSIWNRRMEQSLCDWRGDIGDMGYICDRGKLITKWDNEDTKLFCPACKGTGMKAREE